MNVLDGAYVKIYRADGQERTWRSLWRLRPRVRVLFIGRVTSGYVERRMNRPASASIQAEDLMADLQRRLA
jgi:hypothetical protein